MLRSDIRNRLREAFERDIEGVIVTTRGDFVESKAMLDDLFDIKTPVNDIYWKHKDLESQLDNRRGL